MRYVIDASAALAFLRGEKGQDFLDQADDPEAVLISTVNIGEVAARQLRDNPSRKIVEAAISAMGLVSIPVSVDHAFAVAELRETARAIGLSQADCLCIALAQEQKVILLTADRAMADFAADCQIAVKLIR